MALTEANKRWMKLHTTYIPLRFNHRTDHDILQALEGKAKQTEIKRLIRIALDVEKQKEIP